MRLNVQRNVIQRCLVPFGNTCEMWSKVITEMSSFDEDMEGEVRRTLLTLDTIQRSTGMNAKASQDIQPMSASFSDLAHLHCGNCMKIAGDQPRRGQSPAIRSVTGLVNWCLLDVHRGRSRSEPTSRQSRFS